MLAVRWVVAGLTKPLDVIAAGAEQPHLVADDLLDGVARPRRNLRVALLDGEGRQVSRSALVKAWFSMVATLILLMPC